MGHGQHIIAEPRGWAVHSAELNTFGSTIRRLMSERDTRAETIRYNTMRPYRGRVALMFQTKREHRHG